jgi:hypothetical protein
MLNYLKKILTLILCFMMSSTMVFAEHTKANISADIFSIIDYTNSLKNQKNIQQCSPKVQVTLLNKLESQIVKAKNSTETLDESIARYQQKFSYVHYKQAKQTNKLLRNNRKLNRVYRKTVTSNPNLTFNQMVENLKYSISNERKVAGLERIESELIEAGSLVNYLEILKSKIENCVDGAPMLDGDTMGIILLILFIGLPVLSLLAALITLVIGAFSWALGFLIFAVAMLAIFFIWAQIDKSVVLNSNQFEKTE